MRPAPLAAEQRFGLNSYLNLVANLLAKIGKFRIFAVTGRAWRGRHRPPRVIVLDPEHLAQIVKFLLVPVHGSSRAPTQPTRFFD
jgi:hypothetical protein